MTERREIVINDPALNDMHSKLLDAGDKIGREMEKANEYPNLILDANEVMRVLSMDSASFSEFLTQKGIDFEDPVMLTIPGGTAEVWMKSPDDIMTFLRRIYPGKGN